MAVPFTSLSDKSRRQLLILSIVGTLVFWLALRDLDGPLRCSAAPHGIISFEMAGSLAKSSAILAAWTPQARVHAGLSLGIDYIFLLSYSVLLALLVSFAVRKVAPISSCVASVGVPVAWFQLAAGALDGLENLALIRLLLGSTRSFWPPFARMAALVKFTFVGAGFGFLLIASLWILWRGRATGE